MTAKQFLKNYGWDKKSVETKMDMPTMVALMEKYLKERFPPGTYVSKAVWAKVTEENKSMIRDLFILLKQVSVNDLMEAQEVRMKWRKRFKERKDLTDMLFEIAKRQGHD